MNTTEYFVECLAQSFEDHGLTATLEQIAAIAEDVAAAESTRREQFGYDSIPNPDRKKISDLSAELKKEREKIQCLNCTGSGRKYGMECHKCNGEGRISPRGM